MMPSCCIRIAPPAQAQSEKTKMRGCPILGSPFVLQLARIALFVSEDPGGRRAALAHANFRLPDTNGKRYRHVAPPSDRRSEPAFPARQTCDQHQKSKSILHIRLIGVKFKTGFKTF